MLELDTPQYLHVPTLVPAVTDGRDQPSQATEVATTALLTIEQESKCAAAGCPAQGPTWIPGLHIAGGLPHVPRAHPTAPELTPCSQGTFRIPLGLPFSQGSPHISQGISSTPQFTPHH